MRQKEEERFNTGEGLHPVGSGRHTSQGVQAPTRSRESGYVTARNGDTGPAHARN